MTELLVVGGIMALIAVIATPTVVRNIQVYRLSSAAGEVSTMLKLARYEAIRRNTNVSCRIAQEGNEWVVWVDLNDDGTRQDTESMLMLSGAVRVASSSDAPTAGSMGFVNVSTPWPANPIRFNFRGQINYGANAPSVYAVYLWRPSQPDYGFRALTLTPAGRTKSWRAADGGPWTD